MGIALGGGSIHGVAHVGVLKAFAEKRLKFQFIAGTSAGAVVGVLAAAQLPLGQIELVARRIERPGVLNLSWSGKGLMQNARALRGALQRLRKGEYCANEGNNGRRFLQLLIHEKAKYNHSRIGSDLPPMWLCQY